MKNNVEKIEELSATPEELIKEYWRIVEKCEDKVAVEYGNDLDVIEYGSGFPVRKDLKDMRESRRSRIRTTRKYNLNEMSR